MEHFHARCQESDCGNVRVGINAEGDFGWGHLHEENTRHTIKYIRTNLPHEEPIVFDLGNG